MSLLFGQEHRLLICGLYRRSLKVSLDWIVDRGDWRRFAMAVRQQFDEHAKETSPTKVQSLIQSTQLLLWRYRHPEPYKCTQA